MPEFIDHDHCDAYSSLTHLQRLPVDTLKIDISFVREMLTGVRQQKMVAAIVGMARTLDISVVAEGVETEAQSTALRNMDCDEVQGYLFGRPVPAEEFARAWLVPLKDE